MAMKDILKISRKTFFNPRAWIGYDFLRDQTRVIWTFVRDVTLTPSQPVRTETFEEAMQRLNIQENELELIKRRYWTYAVLFLGLAVVDFLYGIYLLFNHYAFLGFVLASAVCALLLTQAFKYHFWYFQVKNRHLGYSFQEWWAAFIRRKNTTGKTE